MLLGRPVFILEFWQSFSGLSHVYLPGDHVGDEPGAVLFHEFDLSACLVYDDGVVDGDLREVLDDIVLFCARWEENRIVFHIVKRESVFCASIETHLPVSLSRLREKHVA